MKKILLVMMVLVLFAMPVLAEELSDNWMDFQVLLNDELYTLPAPVSAFEENGWTLENDGDDDTLEPNQYTLSRSLKKGDMQVYVQIINLGIDELPVTKCLVGQISLDDYQAKKGATLTVATGITLGSSLEEVEAAYGLPGYTYEGSSITYRYESGSYDRTEFRFDGETKLVTDITARNFTEPEGYNDAAYAAPVEKPQSVADYAPPAELGDDILSFNIRIGDALYTIPASYEYMSEQGWVLGEKQDGKIAAWSYRRMIPIVLGGYKVTTQLYNDSPIATTPDYCFITSLRIEASSRLDVELPGGITLGMNKEALDAILAAQGHEADINETSSSYHYTIKQDILQEINMTVDKEKDEITSITLSNQP